MYQRHVTGKHGEQLAAQYLLEQGFMIIEQNFATRWGEIDIIARQAGTIHFFEVKTRYGTQRGHPFETITAKKRRNIQKAAWAYILKKNPQHSALAIGVVGIILSRQSPEPHIQHIANISW